MLDEGETGKKDIKRDQFKDIFPDIAASEKFVTYYDGLVWENGKLTPMKGIIYLTEKSIAFHSLPDYKLLLQFSDISSITKEKTFMIVSKTIRIVTKDKLQYWVNVVNRDGMYQVMEHLWKDAMRKWQYALDPDGLGLFAATDEMTTSMTLLNKHVKIQEFQNTFKVPESPNSENDIFQAILYLPDRWINGQFCITQNFICYQAKQSLVDLKIVLAFVNILDITPYESMDVKVALNGMKAIRIILQSSNQYVFCLQNRSAVIQKLLPLWNKRLDSKKSILKKTPHYQSNDGWNLDETMTTDPKYIAQQEQRKHIWDNYFNRNGKMNDPIISNRFLTIIEQEGIPDIFRGRLWQICSGSIHQLEAQPGYYYSLLTEREANPSVEAEISRDVTRSLPYHPYFKLDKGISQLSNVLVAYSRRAHHIGYCQAMNIVAATLLLYMSEEEAFWLLCEICENMIPEHYTKGLQLMGSVVEQHIFTKLTQQYFPDIKDHLQEIGTPVDMLTLPWFMTFFIGYIPWKAALRVLDIVFVHGPDFLFLVGLSVLDNTREKLLSLVEGMNVTTLFKEVCKQNPEQLIQDALSKFSILANDSIKSIRQEKKFEMMQNLQENNLTKLFEDMAKTHNKIKLSEYNSLYKQFEKLSLKIKEPNKGHDTISLKSTVIDNSQFQKLIYTLMPHIGEIGDKSDGMILNLIFKRGDRPDKDHLNFEEFIEVFGMLYRGSPKEQFDLFFYLFFTNEDQIAKENFKFILNLLYRFSFTGSVPKEQNSIRLDMFSEIIYESLRGHKDYLTHQQLIDIFNEGDLLVEFWKQLHRG